MPGFGGLFQQTSDQRSTVENRQIGQVMGGGLASSGGGVQAQAGGMAVDVRDDSRADISITTLDAEALGQMQQLALAALESQQSMGVRQQGIIQDVLGGLETAQQSAALSATQAGELASAVAAMSPAGQGLLSSKVTSYALIALVAIVGGLLVYKLTVK